MYFATCCIVTSWPLHSTLLQGKSFVRDCRLPPFVVAQICHCFSGVEVDLCASRTNTNFIRFLSRMEHWNTPPVLATESAYHSFIEAF